MKWGVIFLVFITIVAIALNVTTLKISWFPFVGVIFGVLLFFSVGGHIVYKIIQKKTGMKRVENSFIFPDKLSEKMKKVDLGIQYESSVVSVAFLIIGIVAFNIYLFFFTQTSWGIKIFMVFNSLCGLVLMSSMLVTYYQQLVAYRESTKFINTFASSNDNKVNQKVKKNDEEYDNYPDGYYLADDGNYYDYAGNQVYIESESQNERGYKKR